MREIPDGSDRDCINKMDEWNRVILYKVTLQKISFNRLQSRFYVNANLVFKTTVESNIGALL
jgi:hypothetical protein